MRAARLAANVVREMTPLDAAAAVVLLEFNSSYGLGFVAGGRIVTCFHVVADEPRIVAHLHDGRVLPVRSVCAIDLRRDLAVLDVGLLDATPAKAGAHKLSGEGARTYTYGLVRGERRLRWAESSIDSVQVLGSALTVYGLTGDVPRDASGSPVIDEHGACVGVAATVPHSKDAVLVVPWRYVEPLLQQHRQLPLSVLTMTQRRLPEGKKSELLN